MTEEKKKLPLLPIGKYFARGMAGEYGVSDKGKDYCSVSFAITRGPLEGRRISAFLYFSTEANSERSIESLRYCGCTFPDNDLTNLSGIDKNEVELDIGQETFDGKTSNKVHWINRVGAFVPEEQRMNPAQKATFKERMKAVLVATKQSGSSSGDDEPPPIDDSDLPF